MANHWVLGLTAPISLVLGGGKFPAPKELVETKASIDVDANLSRVLGSARVVRTDVVNELWVYSIRVNQSVIALLDVEGCRSRFIRCWSTREWPVFTLQCQFCDVVEGECEAVVPKIDPVDGVRDGSVVGAFRSDEQRSRVRASCRLVLFQRKTML